MEYCKTSLQLLMVSSLLFSGAWTAEDYRHIGCFKDEATRAIPIMLGTFRGIEPEKTIKGCADLAKSKRYLVFSVQYRWQCFSGPEAEQTYDRYGPATNCKEGVGGSWAADVYTFNKVVPVTRHMTFLPPVIDKALVSHVIEEHITDNEKCSAMCYINHDCVSYNLGPSQTPGMMVCQLNNADRHQYPQHYQEMPGYCYVGSV